MNLEGKKINFLGDSITEGYCASSPELKFVEILRRECKLGAARNYGECGTRIARQTKPYLYPAFDRDYCMRAYEMDKDADIVIVFGGTNDFGHGDAAFGSKGDTTPDTFCGACHALFTELRELFPASQIVVLTPLHRSDEETPNPTTDRILRDYVSALRESAESFGLPVLDLFESSAIRANIFENAQRYTEDGLHPNDEGHKVLADEIAAYLKNL